MSERKGIWTSFARKVAIASALIFVLWVLTIYLAAYFYGDRLQALSARPFEVDGDALQIVLGIGAAESSGVAINRLSEDGEALLVWSVEPFDASAHPVLKLTIGAFPLNYVLMLTWRRVGETEPSFTRLQTPRVAAQTYLMSRLSSWSGQIAELGLYMYPQAQTSPALELDQAIRLTLMRLEADSMHARVASLATSWFAADPWEMMSPSSLGVHPDLEEGWQLTPVLFAFFVIGVLVTAVVFTIRSARERLRLVVGWLLAFVAVIHIHWMLNLIDQRNASGRLYSGLSMADKSARLFDADLVRLTDLAKQQLPKPPSARIFISTDARFFRLRAAWHLRPHNVLTFLPGENIGAHSDLRVGDYLFVYRRPDLMQQARDGSLALNGGIVPVRVVLTHDDGGLLEFKRPMP